LLDGWNQDLIDAGYIHAAVYLDSSYIQEAKIHSKLRIDAGEQYFIDTIMLVNESNLGDRWIRNMIQLESGMPYAPNRVAEAVNQLNKMKFLEVSNKPQIVFFRNKAIIQLFIKEKKQSYLDALLGLLPGSPPDNRFRINGSVQAQLVNQFKVGETVSFLFQSLQNSSQQLRLELQWPYLLALPFEWQARLNLFRRDSLFQEIRSEWGAAWLLKNGSKFTATLGYFSSTLIQPDLERIQSTKKLPSTLDITHSYLFTAWEQNGIRETASAPTGYSGRVFVSGASRRIRPNVQITSLRDPADSSFSYETLYAPYRQRGYALEGGIEGDHFTLIGKQARWYKMIKGHWKEAATDLTVNEMYRLGGFRSIRGFDEESIFASRYLLLKNEVRLYTDPQSYFFIHADIAWFRRFRFDSGFNATMTQSFGGGIILNTNLGLLSIAASLGKWQHIPLDWNAVKLHIGYINGF
jgi:outer membrane protein assembly factor BamA